jgi:hypothetical protein
MAQQISSEQFTKQFFSILEETFAKGNGIYLDAGTSLLETLAAVPASEASVPTVEGGTTIAGHVEHIRFYVRVLRDYMEGKSHENLDWKQSWLTSSVTDSEWRALLEQLREDFDSLMKQMRNISDWDNDRRLGGALAIVAHTAFHLGSIRQIAKLTKKQRVRS